jgi:hypothetical protein
MKSLLLPASLVVSLMLAVTPVMAQQPLNTVPTPTPHIITPPGSITLSSPATSPLLQQMQDDYATQLRAAQQQLLQQNPSGLTRPELGISRTLNGFTPQ